MSVPFASLRVLSGCIMNIIEIVEVGTIMILGGIIQSSVGFGFGLFALPILLFFGFDLPAAVIIVIIGSAIQKLTAVRVLSHAFKWKDLFPYMAVGLMSLPLGVTLMFRLSTLDQSITRQIIGILILLLLLLRWRGAIKTREHVPPIWGLIAACCSGLLNGLANIGGPPMVLWVLSHQWPNDKMRVILLAFSLVFVPFQLLLMLWLFGTPILSPLGKALLLSPAVLFGTWLGLLIGKRFSPHQLKVYMQTLLLLIALSSILKPLF